MKSTRTWFFPALLGLALVLVWTGCSTPGYRIRQNPELFASFPEEVQLMIRNGSINIGFSTEMVTMALGTPARIYTRQTERGWSEVWAYTAFRITTERQRVNATFNYKDDRGRMRTANDWVWVDVNRETEYERMRVEFNNNKVFAFEALQR